MRMRFCDRCKKDITNYNQEDILDIDINRFNNKTGRKSVYTKTVCLDCSSEITSLIEKECCKYQINIEIKEEL